MKHQFQFRHSWFIHSFTLYKYSVAWNLIFQTTHTQTHTTFLYVPTYSRITRTTYIHHHLHILILFSNLWIVNIHISTINMLNLTKISPPTWFISLMHPDKRSVYLVYLLLHRNKMFTILYFFPFTFFYCTKNLKIIFWTYTHIHQLLDFFYFVLSSYMKNLVLFFCILCSSSGFSL